MSEFLLLVTAVKPRVRDSIMCPRPHCGEYRQGENPGLLILHLVVSLKSLEYPLHRTYYFRLEPFSNVCHCSASTTSYKAGSLFHLHWMGVYHNPNSQDVMSTVPVPPVGSQCPHFTLHFKPSRSCVLVTPGCSVLGFSHLDRQTSQTSWSE